MYPFIHVNLGFFEHDLSTYGLTTCVGFLFFIIPGFVYSKRQDKDVYSRFVFLALMLIFGALGAAILYEITNIPYWIKVVNYLKNNEFDIRLFQNIGFVYYGGFIGIFVGMNVYARLFHEDIRRWLRETIVSIPGFHAVGRIGCLLAGCCYGIEVKNGGIYNINIDKYCMPVQLYEAAAELIIFIVILVYNCTASKRCNYYKPLGLYCTLYAPARFILEFWRGDKIRGIWGPLSTSQYISIIIFAFGIYCLLCNAEKNFLNSFYNKTKVIENNH